MLYTLKHLIYLIFINYAIFAGKVFWLMEHLTPLIATYGKIVTETERKLKKVKQQIYRISTLRLILFIAGVVGIIYFWLTGWMPVILIACVTFIPFLFLIKRHNRLFYEKDYLEKKIYINKQELEALNYNIFAFDGGNEYIDATHLYTYDLDVFGEHSLFQYINRTSTLLGKRRLASWFNAHLKNKAEIERRQAAVQELAPQLETRQQFRILGLLYKGQPADEKEIKSWAQSPSYYRRNAFFRSLPFIVPAINIILIALAMTDILPFSLAGVVFVAIALLSFLFSKGITRMQTLYGKKMQILGTYARLIRIIEEAEPQSEALKEVKSLVCNNKKTVSQAVKRLTDLMNALDQRNNIMMAMVLNGFLFWELRQAMRIEAWKESYAANMPQWLEALSEMDAYCSLATFAYNHPHYVYPHLATVPFCMIGEALGHPLMNRKKCVRNNINIEKRPFFVIITGANMAGKSTYLRTVGVNYLLACVGAPVCAERLTLYPSQLITSLRTSDSLTDNESYFFAELKRLKLIIDKLNAGEQLFIILDEVLKGTNSMDKQKGSFALIKQFMALQVNGIIATHDLLLGELAALYPNDICNYCFEADISNNELTFSYQLKNGVAQNMNACFLMKKMGIAVADDD